ncbi:MAG: PepSY-associated TM helix domain-containing protein [Novosphingobium sp.]
MTRTTFLVFHRRLALVFAPLLLLQALTGSALLFKAPLARIIDPAGMTRHSNTGAAPVSAMLAAAERQSPGFRTTRLYLPTTAQDTAFAQMTGPAGAARYASLDPGSGAVLAAGPLWRFPLEGALQLHYRLLDGTTGMIVVLANGLALALLSCTGLGYWWPGRKRAIKSLAVRKAAPARIRLRQWHRSAGVIASLLVLFSATTGVLLAAPDIADALAASPSPPTTLPPRSAAQIDRAITVGAARFPGAALRDIRFPLADRIDINLFAPSRNPRAVHVVKVGLSDGQVTSTLPAQDNSALWMKVLSLHTGDSFGLIGRLLLLAEGAVLIFAAISGPLMWWRRRSPRPKEQ